MSTTLRRILLAVLVVLPARLSAQGVLQATLTGIPPILTTPSIGGQLQRYHEGSYVLQVVYSSPGSQPVPVSFRMTLEHEGQTVVDITSQPVPLQPGVHLYRTFDDPPAIQFPQTLANVLSDMNARLGGQVSQSGLLLEGMYLLTIEPVVDPALLIPALPATASFLVSYAEPPVLITPSDNETISPDFPVFSWTSVAGLTVTSSVEYEVLIVKVWPNQTPQQAILGNAPHHRAVLPDQTVFTYGPDLLRLENGSRYAWQVTAREPLNNSPILNEGRSEVFTFRVNDAALGGGSTESFTWDFPSADPFVHFVVPDAQVATDRVSISGRYQGTVAGRTSNATFDNVVLSPDGSSITGGRVTLDRPVAVRARISPTSARLLNYEIVSSGTSLDEESSVQFEPGIAQITSEGLIALGQGRGSLRYGSVDLDNATVTPSADFLLSLSPLGIARGRITYAYQGLALGYADATGFHSESLTPQDLLALLPDQLAVPSASIATIPLKRAGVQLVDASVTGDGLLAITPKPGEQLFLVMPALAGAPELPVQLENIRVTPGSQRIRSGKISGSGFGESERRMLENRRIPLLLDALEYTPNEGLNLIGPAVLFGEELGGTIRLRVTESGTSQGAVTLQNVGKNIQLVQGSDKAVMHLEQVHGTLDFNILSGETPLYEFNLEGRILLGSGAGAAAGVAFTAMMNQDGRFTLTGTSPATPQNPVPLDLDNVKLRVRTLEILSLSYDPISRFGFTLETGLSLLLTVDKHDLEIELSNIELRPDGFFIPEQNVNESTPGFRGPPFNAGPVSLRCIAFRIPSASFDWFSWSSGTPHGLNPRFDFEVNFPGFRTIAGQLAYAPVTLQNATLDGRFLSGNLLPYEFTGSGVLVPFGSDQIGFRVRKIEGSLSKGQESQAFDIRMSGSLHAPVVFPGDTCPPPELTLSLSDTAGFTGRRENIRFCAPMQLGPVTVTIESGYLDFAVAGGRQSVRAGGQASARFSSSSFSGPAAAGSIEVDLVARSIRQSGIVFRDLEWSYPRTNPLFRFGVPQASVTPDGFVLSGTGTLKMGTRLAETSFSNVGVGYERNDITAGEIQIKDTFAIEIRLDPVRWSTVRTTSLAMTDSNRVLLVMKPGLKITKDGMPAMDSSKAHLNALGRYETNLSLRFQNFVLGFDPLGVSNGKAELFSPARREAFLDRSGFNIDDPLASLPIPDTLALGGRNIAYLLLKDSLGATQVELGNPTQDGTGRTLKTKAGKKVRLVLAAIGQPDKHPVAELSFELIVNGTTYEIIGGFIEADLSNSPLNLTSYGFPFDLTVLRFSNQGSGFRLTAGARVSLPAKLTGMDVPLNSLLTFSEQGFESADIRVGNFSQQRAANASSQQPLASIWLGDSAVGLNVRGVNIMITPSNAQFAFCGDLDSKLFGQVDSVKAQFHYVSTFNVAEKKWDFTLNTNHLPNGKIPISKAVFTQNPNTPLTLTISPEKFALTLAGVLAIPDLGENFSIAVERVYLGSDKVEIAADVNVRQSFDLFGDFLTFTVDRVGVDYSSTTNVVYLEMDGKMDTKITRQQKQQGTQQTNQQTNQQGNQQTNQQDLIEFRNLRVGTDGSFSLGQAQLNLLAGRDPIQVLPNIFWLNELSIGYRNNAFVLGARGTVEIPVPGRTQGDTTNAIRSAVGMVINHRGEMVEPLSVTFAFDPGPVPRIGNNPATEVSLAGIATVELTGAALDFDITNPINTSLYATAAVHLHPQGQPSSNQQNTDSQGRARVFSWGNASNIRTEYGIKYNFQTGLQYRLSIQSNDSNPVFELKVGMFSLNVTSISLPDPTKFEVTIGGRASLDLGGVSGSFGFSGFKFGEGGVMDWGAPSGAIQLSVINVVSLEVGGFEFRKAEQGQSSVQLIRQLVTLDSQGKETQRDTSFAVREYLRFRTVQISLGADGAFSGGVREVLYYRDTNGGVAFYIDDANFQLGDAASLRANLEFIVDNTGFLLRVSGVGKVQNIGFFAAGKISTRNNQLSFGIFLAATGFQIDLLPIVPGTIVLTGAGGGFFYRPEMRDLEIVLTGLNQMTGGEFRANNPNGLPRSDNLIFAVMLYAEVGLVGSSSGFAVKGNALLIITDQFASLDINGTILGQTGKLSAGAYLTFVYPKPGDGSFAIEGGVRVNVNYGPVATANITVDFFIAKRPNSSGITWAAWGNADVRIMAFITMHGDFLVSNNGLLVNLGYSARLDVSIITIQGQFNLSFWYYIPTQSLGVYAELSVKADVLGGIVTVSASLKGALIVEGSSYLVYAAASARVKVFAVFDGSIGLWVAVRNNQISGGTGRNSQYEQMIQNSRNQVASLKREAQVLQAQIAAAQADKYDFSFADLQQAGLKLRLLASSERKAFADQIYKNEADVFPDPANRAILRSIADSLFAAASQPVDANAQAAFQAMNAKLEEMQTRAAELSTRLEELEVAALELRQFQAEGDLDLRSPLDASEPYTFSIDTDLEERQVQRLNGLKQDTDALDAYYRSAIVRGFEALASLDGILSGNNGVNEFLPVFIDAYTAVGRYYALQTSYHYESVAWSFRAANYLGGLGLDLWNVFNRQYESIRQSPTVFTRDIVQALARRRYESIKSVASATDSLLAQTTEYAAESSEYNNYLSGLSDGARVTELTNKGRDLWYFLPLYGLYPFRQVHWNAAAGLWTDYRNIVWGSLRERFEEITGGVNRLYTIKSQMIENQVALLDEFLAWRGDVLEEGEIAGLRTRRRALALTLEPPRITSMTVQPEREQYLNRVHIAWEASHPSGPVAESIVRVIRSYDNILVTVGDRTSMDYFAFGQYWGAKKEYIKFEIAVRSPGGTLFFTKANDFEVAVAPEGDSEGGVATGETNILPTDAYKPPTQPELTIGVGEYNGSFWVSRQNAVPFVASAYDPAGSRVTFEAAVGTDGNEADVLDWTPMPSGKRIEDLYGSPWLRTWWGEILGHRLELGTGENELPISIEEVTLSPGRLYQVSVRAINAFALTSPVSQFNVRYDDSPPAFSGGEGSMTVPPSSPRTPGVVGGTVGAPERPEVIQPLDELERIRTEQRRKQTVPVTITVPEAVDPESGILGYEFLLTTEPSPEAAFASGQPTIRSQTPSAEVFCDEYLAPLYAHVRAVNYAGAAATFTVGPVPPPQDPTLPDMAQTRIGNHEGELVLWITAPGFDKETGVTGYQFAVGTDPWETILPRGTTDLRPWPADTTVDFRYDAYDIAPEGNLAGGYIIRNPSAFESADRIYFYTRAVNTHGLVSDFVPTGGTNFSIKDVTPPVVGSFDVEYFRPSTGWEGRDAIRVSLPETYDPGTGIRSMRFEVTDAQTGEQLFVREHTYEELDWTRRPGTIYQNPFVRESGLFRGRLLRIAAVLTNGAGLTTRVSHELDLLPRPPAQPSVTARVETRGWAMPMLRIQVTNIHDPKFGVRGVDFRVDDATTGAVVKDWTDAGLTFVNGLWLGSPMATEILDGSTEYSGKQLRVLVRVRNDMDQTATAETRAATR